MNNQFRINNITLHSGWLDMSLQKEDQETVINASFLSDAVSDFVMAVVLMCEGSSERTLIWMNEPGETKWIFNRTEQEVFVKVIYSLYNERTMVKDDEVLFQANVSLIRLGREVLRAMNRLKLEYPGSNYQSVWHQDYLFPENTIQRLSESIMSLT